MSERDGYQHGVPCWVDTWQPDLKAAVDFYTGLFGWDAEETSPPGAPRRHFMCTLRGRRVTGIGSPPPVPGHTPVWGTYVWVDDVENAVAKAKEAGGTLVLEPHLPPSLAPIARRRQPRLASAASRSDPGHHRWTLTHCCNRVDAKAHIIWLRRLVPTSIR
jgi:predicted enzyme related to lactoylglutathione lyase